MNLPQIIAKAQDMQARSQETESVDSGECVELIDALCALRSPPTVKVLVIRDPDASNEFYVDVPDGHAYETFDLDLGRGWSIGQIGGEADGELRDELLEFADTWVEIAAGITDPSPEVRRQILLTVREVLDRAGFPDTEIDSIVPALDVIPEPVKPASPITPELTVDPEAFRQHFGPDAPLEDDERAYIEAATDEQIAEALTWGFSGDYQFFWDAFDECCQHSLARLAAIVEEDRSRT